MSEIIDDEKLVDQLPVLIAAQKSALAGKQNEMAALKNAGLIYANEHWRSDKYLYLIYPSRDGARTEIRWRRPGQDRGRLHGENITTRKRTAAGGY